METPLTGEEQTGLNRRSVLKRGAIVGGAMVWTVPAVQTLAAPAFAAGTPCASSFTFINDRGICFSGRFNPTASCCDCVATRTNEIAATLPPALRGLAMFLAVASCSSTGTCQVDPNSLTPCA